MTKLTRARKRKAALPTMKYIFHFFMNSFFQTTTAPFSNYLAKLFRPSDFSQRFQTAYWLSMIFFTLFLNQPLSQFTSCWASINLSTRESLYPSQILFISLLAVLMAASASSLACSLRNFLTSSINPNATLSGYCSSTQAQNRRSLLALIRNQFPLSEISFSRCPTLELKLLALETISLAQS